MLHYWDNSTVLCIHDFNWERRKEIVEVILNDGFEILHESDADGPYIEAGCADGYGFLIRDLLAEQIAEANGGPCKLHIYEFGQIAEHEIIAASPMPEIERVAEPETEEMEYEDNVRWEKDGF